MVDDVFPIKLTPKIKILTLIRRLGTDTLNWMEDVRLLNVTLVASKVTFSALSQVVNYFTFSTHKELCFPFEMKRDEAHSSNNNIFCHERIVTGRGGGGQKGLTEK